MSNIYAQLKELLDPAPVQIATVISVADGVAVLELPGGGRVRARGAATVGGKVFFQGEVIQGAAPDLPTFVDVI